MEHTISTRAGVGSTARIVQKEHLRFSRVTVPSPVIIAVKHGRKELRAPGLECVLEPGDAVAIGQGQVLDIINTPGPDGQYQADWLVFDPPLISGFTPPSPASPVIDVALGLRQTSVEFTRAIDAAVDAIRRPERVPDAVAIHRLNEVLTWINVFGGRFELREPATVSASIRRLILSSPDVGWTATAIAAKVAMSEATLRRRLTEEGTTLSGLIADVRMSFAMQLLQSTNLAVSRIALDVGYESASRFAIRFRKRFGFAPSAIRGHRRSRDARGSALLR